MNWDAIGAVGEMIGSVAVLVTLGYLAVQVRESRHETRRAISQSRTESARHLLLTDATDERIAVLLSKANAAFGMEPTRYMAEVMSRAGPSREDAWRLFSREGAWWNYRTQVIRSIDELSPGQRIEFDRAIRGFYGANQLSSFWYESLKQNVLDPDAVRYIDNLLAQPE